MARISRLFVTPVVFLSLSTASFAQFAEQNVNMVAGTQWPGGDPFLRQQNEPSFAVSQTASWTRKAVGSSVVSRATQVGGSRP